MEKNDSLGTAREGSPRFRLWAVLSLAVVVGVVIFVPARIGLLGYMPPDDAGRHIGKAISGKPWNQILVMRPEITTDMHHGWDTLLAFLHTRLHLGADALMAFSVSICFIVFAVFPLLFLRRPEAWIATIGMLLIFDPFMLNRIFLGRPFILSCGVLSFILLSWEKFKGRGTSYPHMLVLFVLMTIMAWMAPTAAYLFAIPLFGFILARQWQALARLVIGIGAGCVTGYCLTGYPVKLAKDVFFMLTQAPDQHVLSRMLVSEFVPVNGNFLIAAVVCALIAVRVYRKKWDRSVIDNPVFFNAVVGLFLGFAVGRFWFDWGMVAALVWIAKELGALLEEFVAFDSLRRFTVCAITAVCFFFVITSDIQSRWTFGIPRYPLVYEQATAEQKPWYPDSGGIMYNDNMCVFFETFYHNPHAPWRYMVGFEPVIMKPEDLATYRNIQRNNGSTDTYEPWVKKMRPCDRMVFLSETEPKITQLEWRRVNRNKWLGRIPRTAPQDSISKK